MSLRFIFGPSGAGKSHYIYNKIINASLDKPDINYILLVPEQYSMALQRKMVKLHPHGGTMNIDVIGFNRLAYRVFDELNVRPMQVLEDFGKTMLIRQAAGTVKDKLTVYGGCLDKSGFIDEVKSLMSEMYQYDISRDRLSEVIEIFKNEKEQTLLLRKLVDMQTIFSEFDKRLKDTYIVAEQLTELLAEYVSRSEMIKNSVIVMDGFTGFTPIQLNLIKKLMVAAIDIEVVLTIDEQSYNKKLLAPHELFYLSKQTKDSLLDIAEALHVPVLDDVFIGTDSLARWNRDDGINYALWHLEKNIFRYPYEKYHQKTDAVRITEYDTPRKEILGVAHDIRRLVMEKGYRYKDIAVITGNLEGSMEYVEQLFPILDIPYFLDYSRPVKNNPYVDAIGHALNIVADNFSYDSVFSFLKSGVVSELDTSEIELLENYCLARGIRGISWWRKEFDSSVEDTRSYVMEILEPFYSEISGKNIQVKTYVKALYELMDRLDYEERMAEPKGLYEKLCEVLDKMTEIMPDDYVLIKDFAELIDLGLKDITLGMIPNMLDMVIVGDITRTRLDDVKVLYIIGVNDGIIPKKGTPAQIISDREKEKLSTYSLVLAPTEKLNSYVEQFYLYLNMTKPSDILSLSYSLLNCNNDTLRPSYIIGRVKNIFPDIEVKSYHDEDIYSATCKSGIWTLIHGLNELSLGNTLHMDEIIKMYKVYIESGIDMDSIERAMCYSNVPASLTREVSELIRLKLMSQSVSRLERFANCAYAYFLQYTLGLRERREKKIDNRDIGTILHGAMEKLYRHVHDECDNEWDKITDEYINEHMTQYVNDSFDSAYEGQDIEEGRYEYLRDSLVRIGVRTASVLSKIVAGDSLMPEYFEYRFKENVPYGEEGHAMTLQGIVDRADVHYSAENKTLSMRVIDYKSGMHDFKVNELYEGLQLQLAMYTNIMLELADRQYNQNNIDGGDIRVYPEGMYYYTMRDPYVDANDDMDAEKKREKELKLKGLVNDENSRFTDVLEFARLKACDIAKNIADGVIDKYPVNKGGKAVCEYCTYASVCRFDDKYGGNKYHYLKYKDSDKDKVYEEISSLLGGVKPDVD